MVGRAVLGCAVLCCMALCVVVVCGPPNGGVCCVGDAVCCVVWRCVLWWCVAPLMVGRVVVVCGPPLGGGALLASFGRLSLVVALLLLGRVGWAGLPSVCRAPPRVVVSRVSSPGCMFSRVLLSCVCAVVGQVLAGASLCPPPPPGGLCLAGVDVAPLLFLSLRACWFPLLAARGRLLPPVVPPPPGSFRFCCFLPSVARFRALALRVALALLSRFRSPAPSPNPPCLCSAGVATLRLVFPCVPAACLLLRSPDPPVCVSRLALRFPLCSPCLLFSALPSAVCLRLVLPPPPPCLSLFRGHRRPCCFAFLRADSGGSGCGGPCCIAPCWVVLRVWCGAALCWLGLPCALWCLLVLCGAAASGVAPCVLLCVLLCRAAVFSAVCLGLVSFCVPCCLRCVLLCCPGVFFCVLSCAASLGAVLRCVCSCCSVPCCVAVHCVVCMVPCCFFPLFWLLFRAVLCPWVLCALLRAVLCCFVLCCCVLCCVSGYGVLVRCAVLFALCFAVVSGSAFLCAVLCLLALSCAAFGSRSPGFRDHAPAAERGAASATGMGQ